MIPTDSESKKEKNPTMTPISFRVNKEEKKEMKKDMKLLKTKSVTAYIKTLIKNRGNVKTKELDELYEELKKLDENYQKTEAKLANLQKMSSLLNSQEILEELKIFREEHINNIKKTFNVVQRIHKEFSEY